MRKIIKLFTLLILGSSLFISACNSDEKLSNQKNDLITYVDGEIDTLESSLITKIDETIAKINALEEKHDAKVLELEDIDKSIKEVQDAHANEINSLNDELDSLVAQYETKISELESKDKELKDSLSALELEIANQNELNEAKHNSLTSEIEKANSDLAKLEEDYNNEVKTLNDNLGLLQKELNDFELQVENQDKANAETHNNLLKNILEVTNQITALDNKYKAETDTLKERQGTLQDELNVLEERIENNETIDLERYNELLEEISSLNEELSALSTKHNNEVKTLSDNLNLLQKELDDFELQVENQDKANAETHSSLLQSITNVTNELSALDTKHSNDVTSLNTKLDSLQNELNELETLMSEQDKLMKEEYTSLVNQLEEVDKEIKEVNENQNKNIKEIEDNIALVNETHERDIETLTNQKNEIIEEINTIKTDIESLNSNLSKEISDVKTSLNLLESMLKNEDTRLQGEITKLNNLVDTLSTLIESNNGKINELQQELGYLKSEVEDLRNELEEKVCDEHNVLDWKLVEVLEDGTKIYVQKCDKCDTIIDMNIEKYEGEYIYDHNIHYIINEDGTYSNANNHIFIDGKCVECGVDESITVLEFSLLENGLEYSLVGQNSTWLRELVIPREYKGLPVTTVRDGIELIAGEGMPIIVPDSVVNLNLDDIDYTYNPIYLEATELPEGNEEFWFSNRNYDLYLGYKEGKNKIDFVLYFDGTYESAIAGIFIENGEEIYNLPTIINGVPNYVVFLGVYDQIDDGTQYFDNQMNGIGVWNKDEDTTLYLIFNYATFTIEFDANGGEGEMESVNISYDEAYNNENPLPTNTFTNGDMTFLGWSLYEDGHAMYKNESSIYEPIYDVSPLDGEVITLYAIWSYSKLGIDLYELQNEQINVTFWHAMGSIPKGYLDEMILEFNKIYPNITIEHSSQGGYDDIYNKINNSIYFNSFPVMAYAYPQHVSDYVNDGISLKLNDYVEDSLIGFGADDGISTGREDGIADFVPGFWEEGTKYDFEGSIYSVPFTKSTEAMFINKTFLINNGFVDQNGNPIYPTKWENENDPNDYTAMINLCRAIKAIDPNLIPLSYDSDYTMYITFAKQYGVPYVDLISQDNDIKGNFEFLKDNRTIELIKKIKSWIDEGLITTLGTSPNNQYGSTKFRNQEIIMTIGSTGGTRYNVPEQDTDGNYEFEADVAPIPQQNPTNPVVVSQGPSITFFDSDNITDLQKAAGWLFYKFITNTENTAAWSIKTGYEPVRLSAYETPEYQDHLNKLGTSQETLFTKVSNMTNNIKNWYFTPFYFDKSYELQQSFNDELTNIYTSDFTFMTEEEINMFISSRLDVIHRFIEEGIIEEEEIKISKISQIYDDFNSGILGEYYIKGTVSAISSRGFTVYDGTKNILVYTNTSCTYSIGDYVSVYGSISQYAGNPEFTSSAIITLLEESAPYESVLQNTTPEIFDGTAMTDWLNDGGIGGQYISIDVELTKSGSYYNLYIDGTTVVGSIYNLHSNYVSLVESYLGQNVTIEGVLVYCTGSSTKYANILVTNIYTKTIDIYEEIDSIEIPTVLFESAYFPTKTKNGLDISWYSYDESLITIDEYGYASITRGNQIKEIYLYAQVYDGNETVGKQFNVLLPSYNILLPENGEFSKDINDSIADSFGISIPCIGDSYEFVDYTSQAGYPYKSFYLYNVEPNNFNQFLNEISSMFSLGNVVENNGNLYYYYTYGDNLVRLIYLKNSDVVVFHICENHFDQPIVDGSLDINVYNLIKNTFNIELPIAGEKYQFSDYTETYGFDCYLILLYPLDEAEFNDYLELCHEAFADFDYYTEIVEDVTYHMFNNGETIVQVCYDVTYFGYAQIYVYHSANA